MAAYNLVLAVHCATWAWIEWIYGGRAARTLRLLDLRRQVRRDLPRDRRDRAYEPRRAEEVRLDEPFRREVLHVEVGKDEVTELRAQAAAHARSPRERGEGGRASKNVIELVLPSSMIRKMLRCSDAVSFSLRRRGASARGGRRGGRWRRTLASE